MNEWDWSYERQNSNLSNYSSVRIGRTQKIIRPLLHNENLSPGDHVPLRKTSSFKMCSRLES